MNWKKALTELLKQIGLICSTTEQIIINCNNGAVSDVKKIERIK